MKILPNLLLGLGLLYSAHAQQPASSPETIITGLAQKASLEQSSLVKNIPLKNVGPTIMSGRIVDVAVNPENPNEFYAAYASGGLWHTTNNGTSFTPVLDNAATQNIGDIAVDWNNSTIWVGTGENNASRSSYAGIGILKSTDLGKTWEHMGLPDSHHIGRILINPNNPNEVVIGVTGHLYSPNNTRGIYKTTDGGKTWKQTLFINATTGIIDIAVAPNNFKVQYAAAWEKDRKAWNFSGNGQHSGIYKSTDAGETWAKISDNKNFPTGEGVGRIGLAVFDENTVYAVHDNQNRRTKGKKPSKHKGLTKEDFKTMNKDNLLTLSDKKLNRFLKQNGFHEKYRAANVKQLVRSGNVLPIDLAHYLEDANSLLFDTPVIGAEVYITQNGGSSWNKTHDQYIDDLFYSYGYYFGQIRVHPTNKNTIYLAGVPLIASTDGGKTFTQISKENVHADHHALWINPDLKGHLINGNDGGINISYDGGEHWIKCNTPSVGQFYAINVDNESPYNIYGGLQDNGVWVGPNTYTPSRSWHQEGQYPYEGIMGGDGMQIMIDNRDANIIYTGYQFGNYYRINRETEKRKYIQPKHELGERPYRFNWQTPILLSEHNQDILYLGGNKLMRSMNQGDDWTAISKDLTQGGKKGNVAYGTLTCIAESPFKFGHLITGSDDGLVYTSKNGGDTWTDISNGLPKDLWVSRVIASQHHKDRIYVALNGYRWDDFSAYIFKSDNNGATWQPIAKSLPASPVNVIREDLNNENILYAGTDNGLYVTFDQGLHWYPFTNGLPAVAVHDVVIQKKTNDLIIGTHGRSIYKTNVKHFKNYDIVKNKAVHIFDLDAVHYSNAWGQSWSAWAKTFKPQKEITVFSNTSGTVEIQIQSEKGKVLQSTQAEVSKGFNIILYDMSITKKGKETLEKEDSGVAISQKKNGKFYLPIGRYNIVVNKEKATHKTSLTVK